MVKLTVFCVTLTLTFRLLLVMSNLPSPPTQVSDDVINISMPIVDTADAGYMPRDAQLEVIKGLIKSQNACFIQRPKKQSFNNMSFWQLTNTSVNELLAYSAFYDDRPAVGVNPVVQVLGVSTSASNIYCHLWYDDVKTPFVTKAKVTKSGRGDKMKKIFYGQYLYTCSLPGAHPVPTHVSLTFGKCQDSTIYLPVFLPVRSQWTVEFGICVAISYGNLNKQDFIEWMEFNHILGVSEVHIYNGTLDPGLNTLFQMYRKENRLFVHSMPPPKDIATKMGSKLASPASINDCMLRFMYRYRYILVIDFDEIIIPRKSRNLHDLIISANRHHKLKEDNPIYTFHNTYFYTNFNKTSPNSLKLKTLEYTKSMKPNPVPYAPKSMVDPRKCFSMFNHYCYIQFPQYSKYRWFRVDDSIARSHHYKNCPKKCQELESNSTLDNVVERYSPTLTNQVQSRLKMFNNL